MAQKGTSGDISVKVRLFRYAPINKRVLRLRGGTGDLSTFIQFYSRRCKDIQAPGMQYPVIIVIDNDAGAQNVFNVVKSVTGATTKPDGTAPFYYVTRNLYVVPTPLGGQKSMVIEDLFDASIKGVKLNGKSFNPSDNYNRKTEFGKMEFAERIVQKGQGAINFDGFKPLLANIEGAIAAHAAGVP